MRRFLLPVVFVAVCSLLAVLVLRQYWFDPQRRFALGMAALQAGDLDRVAAEAKQLDRDPRFALHQSFLRGASLLRNGAHKAALQEFEKCHDHPDLEQETLVLTGQALYQIGESGRAKLCWEQALALDPDMVDAHRWLGAMYFDLGAMDHAIEHLQRVSELDTKDPRADRLMGLINKDYERTHLAVTHYRESLRRDPRQADAEQIRLELAEVEIKQKEFAAALATAKECAPSTRQRIIEAECHLNLGEYEDAQRLISDALRESPNDFKALLLQGQILMESGEIDQAVAVFKKSVNQDPSDYHARFHLVQSLRRAGNEAEADRHEIISEELRAAWSKFSDLHIDAIDQPTNAEIRNEIAAIAEDLGRLDLARTWYRAALAIDPNNARALDGLRDVEAKISQAAAASTNGPQAAMQPQPADVTPSDR